MRAKERHYWLSSIYISTQCPKTDTVFGFVHIKEKTSHKIYIHIWNYMAKNNGDKTDTKFSVLSPYIYCRGKADRYALRAFCRRGLLSRRRCHASGSHLSLFFPSSISLMPFSIMSFGNAPLTMCGCPDAGIKRIVGILVIPNAEANSLSLSTLTL